MKRKVESVPVEAPRAEDLRAWAAPRSGPRATVYLPLQRSGRDVRQNAPLLEQAAREVERRLTARGVESPAWGNRVRAIETDLREIPPGMFAVAALLDERGARAFAMPEAVPFSVSVGNAFALRPLLSAMRRAPRYRALALSVKRVALFAGGAEGLAPAPRPGIPTSLEDALGAEITEKELRVRGTGPAGAVPVYYSHGGVQQERKLDLQRFHDALANALSSALEDDGVPLVLVATEEHQGGLRAAARLRSLLDEGVLGSPDYWSPRDLHERAWPVVQRWLAARADANGTAWERARNVGKGLDLLDDIGAAAVAGRVRRLWVDAARALPGRIDPQTGRLLEGAPGDDALDALAELVLARGGEVLPVDAERLPCASGAAAELR